MPRNGPQDVNGAAFVAGPAVERFDVAVAPRSGQDEDPADAFAGPLVHRGASRLGAVVAPQHRPEATLAGETVEFLDEGIPVRVDEAGEAFTGVLIDDGHDLDRSAIGGGVELQVHISQADIPRPVAGGQSLWPEVLALPITPFPPTVDGVPNFSRQASPMDQALTVSW